MNRKPQIFRLESEGISAEISDFGAAVTRLRVGEGTLRDVALGFDDVNEYIASGSYCGATIGRVANRIGGARFSLGGREYKLPANDGDNCNHGGTEGFDRKFFSADCRGDIIELTYKSADGEMGFPGNLMLTVRYKISPRRLDITYTAVCDKDTLWAPTCHLYFNLDGAEKGNCLGNMLKINAQKYTPLKQGMIPSGEVAPVAGTPFDFTSFHALGERIGEKCAQLELAGGYDHNFCLSGEHAATAYGTESGIRLDLYTDMPGMQVYTGNFLRGNSRFGALAPRSGFALEPQFFPNAVNTKNFVVPVLKAGEQKSHYISYIFGSI